MDSLIQIFSGTRLRKVMAKWNVCTKRRRYFQNFPLTFREEMEASNPDSSPKQESSASSSLRSSKIRPFIAESNYGASTSTSHNPFQQKKVKMSFNEMIFMSQESKLPFFHSDHLV
jgi:hypothetical protein